MRASNIELIEKDLGGQFWTRLNEMVDDIEDAGYRVEDANEEYIVIRESEDEDAEMFILYLGHANSTMWIENIREA